MPVKRVATRLTVLASLVGLAACGGSSGGARNVRLVALGASHRRPPGLQARYSGLDQMTVKGAA